MFSYVAYGLGIQSALPLPELVAEEAVADVIIRFGKVALPSSEVNGAKRYVGKTAEGVILFWQDEGAVLVQDGCEIVIDPCPGVEERVLRLIVLGPALGVLLSQRGLSVFHASAVGFPSGAVAFFAAKGLGKSTMAAALNSCGHDLVADDIIALDVRDNDLLVRPGFPQLKLWPESIAAMGEDPASHPQISPHIEKRARHISQGFLQKPMPLRCVFVLAAGQEIEIVPLGQKEALLTVLPHWYGARLDGELLGILGLENHFLECKRLVERVPVFLLKRPYSLSELPGVVRLVEAHVASMDN